MSHYQDMVLHSDGAMVWCVEGMILGLQYLPVQGVAYPSYKRTTEGT